MPNEVTPKTPTAIPCSICPTADQCAQRKEAPPQALKRLLILEGLIGEAHEAIAQIGWENTHSTKPSRWMLAAEKYFHDFPAVVSQYLAAAEPAPSPLTRETATTIECPSGYHQVFVRGDGTIVAHYDDNGGRCCASECKVSPRPDETREEELQEAENELLESWDRDHRFNFSRMVVERADRLRLRKSLEATLESSDALLIAMETCHICKGTIILEESPTHCEDCSWDCDEHEEPECRPIYALHAALKKSVEAARAALRGETK